MERGLQRPRLRTCLGHPVWQLLDTCSVAAPATCDLLCPTHGLQHARSPCPSSSPEVCPSSCPLLWWRHPAISSWCPLLLPPSIFPRIRDFSNESALCIRWPKYWGVSFSVNPSRGYPGFISLKIDWFDPHAVQETLRSRLQHHSSKASVRWCSAFFTVQRSQPYVTTGKITALTIRTLVGKVTSPLFNTLSMFVTCDYLHLTFFN